MDPVLNPFSPGAGARPPILAGRSRIVDEAVIALRRAQIGRPFRSMLFLGLRGTGKTVLLNELSNQARDLGFLVSRLEAPERANLAKMLYPEMRKIFRSLSNFERAKDLASQGLTALRNFASMFHIEIGGVDIGIDPAPDALDRGDLQTDLPDLFEAIGLAARAAGKGWVISLDEVQYLSEEDLSALLVSLHRVSQTNVPVVLMGAGLPQLARLAGEAKSYAERLFRFYNIGALDVDAATAAIQKPIEEIREIGASITDDALKAIVTGTKGYPFFLQHWAACAWDIATGPEISAQDVQDAWREAIEMLDNGFFRVRLDRLTKSELKYCMVMASLGEGPYATGRIAKLMGKDAQQLGPQRASIISKGMIYSTSHGYVDFTVPLFAEFMRRHHLEADYGSKSSTG